MTDVVPADPQPSTEQHRHHKKKTWVTDVNVYSKKKNVDDLNELFNDDNDPLDEYGKNRHGEKYNRIFSLENCFYNYNFSRFSIFFFIRTR